MATLCVRANLFNLNVCLNPGPNARRLCYVESFPALGMTSILGSRGNAECWDGGGTWSEVSCGDGGYRQ